MHKNEEEKNKQTKIQKPYISHTTWNTTTLLVVSGCKQHKNHIVYFEHFI